MSGTSLGETLVRVEKISSHIETLTEALEAGKRAMNGAGRLIDAYDRVAEKITHWQARPELYSESEVRDMFDELKRVYERRSV